MRTAIVFLVLSLALSAHAATFTVTPSVVSNDYTGRITIQMNALPVGETVQVVQYYDFNGNGTVDSADLPVRGEMLSDGQLNLVGGRTNTNVLRDEDGLTNGAIITSFRFASAPEIASGVGHYIFRFSSPSKDFPATSVAFNVVSAPYLQKVQGVVKSNGTNVPYAGVALVQLSLDPAIKVIVGSAADVGGNFVLKAPAGTYTVIGFWPGYVADFNAAPQVTLSPNATVTTNLNLIAATTTLSGALVDSANPALPALPYSQIAVMSTNHLFAITSTDSNANFNVPVTAGLWTVRARWKSAIAHSYLVPEPNPLELEAHFNTSQGPVIGATVALKRATAMIYGTVEDNHSNGIPGITLSANDDGGQYDGLALSDGNGLYSLAMDAGGGFIEVQMISEPPANNYLWTGTSFFVNDLPPLSLNVIGSVATARFRAQIQDDTGAPVTNLFGFASNRGGTSTGSTDANGILDLPVFAGSWQLYLDSAPGLVFPHIPLFTITDGVNLTNDIVARRTTGQISGYLRTTGNAGIANVNVPVTNSVGSTTFTLSGYTDSNGNYSVDVFDGTWNVSVDPLSLYTYYPIAATNITVPPTNAVANFIVTPRLPPQITTTNLPDATIGKYYSVPLLATNGAGTLLWSVTGTLPGGVVPQFFGTQTLITGTPTNLGLFNFTARVTDTRGSNDTRALSINVTQVAGPLQIPTSPLRTAAVGCSYTNQLSAVGGTPPYSWTLPSGAASLPPGLGFDTNGVLSGIPLANGSFSTAFKVRDSLGAFTNTTLSLSVNTALQLTAAKLPPADLGSLYNGFPPVSGGAQPQVWSVLSNSLPPGLALNHVNGLISGTPTTIGAYDFTLLVSDGCTTVDLALSITNHPLLQIATAALPIAALNFPYHAQLQVSGGAAPFHWFTYDSLPGGLTLSSDGSISGTPKTATTTNFLAQVYDGAGALTTNRFLIVVTAQPVLDQPMHSGPQQFTFRVMGISGRSYTVQFATGLTNWADLLTTNAPADVFFLTDTNATNASRVYQLKANP